jgi:UDP-2,3-diacylglucosamine pyrophosphatase LpxH
MDIHIERTFLSSYIHLSALRNLGNRLYKDEPRLIVIVSDLHIGGSEAPFFNKKGFNHFVDSVLKARESEISHLILLGDIVDLWWKPTIEVVRESTNLLLELSNLDMKKYYLIGNHDFDFKNTYPIEIDFEIIEGLSSTKSSIEMVYDSTLRSGGRDFKFIHGHQISYWHALSFYEIFCKAMCCRFDTIPVSNVWNTILSRKDVSHQIRREIEALSEENRGILEYYLAGPLEPSTDDEQKSLLLEWELMNKFEDKTRILRVLEDTEIFEEIVGELEDLVNDIGIHHKLLSKDSGKHVVNVFIEIWRKALQRLDEGKPPQETNEDNFIKARRVAAMLTIGLRHDETLIHGHSHHAYISKSYLSADPGHWLGNAGAYLEIDDGKISLEYWNAR